MNFVETNIPILVPDYTTDIQQAITINQQQKDIYKQTYTILDTIATNVQEQMIAYIQTLLKPIFVDAEFLKYLKAKWYSHNYILYFEKNNLIINLKFDDNLSWSYTKLATMQDAETIIPHKININDLEQAIPYWEKTKKEYCNKILSAIQDYGTKYNTDILKYKKQLELLKSFHI